MKTTISNATGSVSKMYCNVFGHPYDVTKKVYSELNKLIKDISKGLWQSEKLKISNFINATNHTQTRYVSAKKRTQK